MGCFLMWKKTLLALLIVLGLIIQMNVIADPVDVVEIPTRTDGDLEILNITLSGVVINDKFAQVAHTVNVNFTNTGGTLITGKVFNITIWSAATGVEASQFSNAIDDVASGAFVEMELLDFWTPGIEAEYWINVHVNLSAPYGNVSLNKSFTIENVYDVYPVLIYPDENILVKTDESINKSLVCKAKIFNIGNIDATGFTTELEVWETGTRMFNTTETIGVIITPGSNITITFDKWYNHTYDRFDFVVYTELAGDDVIANDMDTKTFNVTYEFYDDPRGNIEGVVLDADNSTIALEGVSITLEGSIFEFNTTTDINGTFNLTGLPVANNSYTLLFALEGYYGARVEDVNVTNATTVTLAENVTMQKIPPSLLYGYVMTEEGTVLPGAYIELGALNATSNETGYYEFVNLTSGAYVLTATLAGYRFNGVLITLVDAEELEYNISMLADVTVTVTFAPESSSIVGDDEHVIITFNAAFDLLTVNTNTVLWEEIGETANTVLYPAIDIGDNNKTIELTLAEPMKRGFNYKVTVTTMVKNAYNESMLDSNASTTFKVKGPEVLSSYPTEYQANVTLTTREFFVVFDIDMGITDPTTDGIFTIRTMYGDPMLGTLAYTGADMKLTFTTNDDLLQEETYQFSVSGYKTAEGGEMEPFATNFDTEKVDSFGTVSGSVLDDNGTAVEGALVELILEGATDPVATTNSGLDGSYEFLDVVPGNYTVRITEDGFIETSIDIEVAAGLDTPVGGTTLAPESEADDDDESFLAKYWWALVIAGVVILLIIIVVIVLMLKKKPEDEEEEDGRRRGRAPSDRAERASYGGGVGEDRDYEGEEGSECPNCGEVVTDDEEDCPNCGVEFEEDAFECPVCGDQIDYEATECPSCGAAFAEDEEDEEGDDDEYDEEEEPDYEVEVEDEDGVTTYNPAEEDEDEEEEYGGEYSEEEDQD